MRSARRIWVIALQTLTEARRNKIFYSLFLFALVVVLNATLFTEVTITTVDRMLKDTGIGAINVFALALTVFTGIGIINREIDRRSIYSILAKPVTRAEFILGKYVGLVMIMVTTCGAMFVCLLLAMKGFRTDITPSIFLGLLGIFLEVAVLAAFALLCSTFTNAFASGFITAAVFISGHLSAELVFYARKSGTLAWNIFGNGLYYVVPNLERFNFKYHVTYDLMVPGDTLALTIGYAAAYTAGFLALAVIVFSRRDFR